MSSIVNSNIFNKIARKQRRSQHIIEKETGILTSFSPTKNVVICNAGLANGLTEENILKSFSKFGPIENIILLPGKSCSFVCFMNLQSAEKAYNEINGKLNLGQDNKPIYLLFSEKVPDGVITNKIVPSGLKLIEDFVTETEEKQLLSCIKWDNNCNSNNLKHRRVKHFGFEFRYDINNVDKNNPLSEGIPQECMEILKRFSEDFIPDQLTINEYQPGQGIPSHVDTHSAFEDPILSLSLGSGINMDFRYDDRQFSLLLPRRSLLIMSGESRYAWTHGITPRKLDILPTKNGLTVQERDLRTSFTFRKLRNGECDCSYREKCDSFKKLQLNHSLAEKLESTHVHQVYEEIALHFSDTRHKQWPNVLNFIDSLPISSILLDVGCGNGKYLDYNEKLFKIGCDRSFNLLEICQTKGFQVFNCNCLYIPIKNDVVDGIISIAVIHHLANEERRLRAIQEIVRVLRIGGRALIYVWAKDQTKQNKSNYLKQDRKNRKNLPENQPNTTVTVGNEKTLPVHVNRTQFQHQDVLVPWKLKQKQQQTNCEKNEEENLFLRFYHVFEEGELEKLCGQIQNVNIVKSYYDQGNWCVIIEKNK